MLTPSQFAVLHGVNPETGRRLRFQGYDYLTEPLDDLSPRVVLMKGSQVGATLLAMLRALWFLRQKQAQSLYLFPTHRSAARFSRGRLATLLERSPLLGGLFCRQKNTTHLRLGNINLFCHGARSRTELLSMPIQYLTIDERDELFQTDPYGRHPWSALELARQRLAGQRESWELNLSTPTLPGIGIAAEYAQSDQHRYMPRCAACRRRAPLTWPASFAWSEADVDRRPAAFCCSHCRRVWSPAQWREALAWAKWVPTHRGRPLRGYHLPQFLSPASTPQRVVEAFRAAQDHPAALQIFYNSIVGVPHQSGGERLKRDTLLAAMAGGEPMQDRSTRPCFLGADVGPDWLHVVVLRPDGPRTRVVWIGKVNEWARLAELLRCFRVSSFVVDAQPETHAARRFLAAHPQGWLCYYRAGDQARVDTAGRALHVPRTASLDALFAQMREEGIRLPRNPPTEFILHLESLVRFLRPGPQGQIRAEYAETTGPDHYAHALNYALLATQVTPQPLHFAVTPPPPGRMAWE